MFSRRNYIAITTMFLILFFMMQFTGVVGTHLSEYGINEYEELAAGTALNRQDLFSVDAGSGELTAYVGPEAGGTAQVAGWWCIYAKRQLVCKRTLAECVWQEGERPGLLLVDGEAVSGPEDVERLVDLADQGIDMVFMSLPEYGLISSSRELRELLGICHVVQESVKVDGLHLFGGFLLGGEAIYELEEADDPGRQDMELTMPWYVAWYNVKTYLVGTLPDKAIEEQVPGSVLERYADMQEISRNQALLPAVIWRNSLDHCKVFCVNGGYLSDASGVGILSAMMAEAHPYELYPVINAQNFVLAGYPVFASENEDEMMRLYSQPLTGVFREIIWPSMASLRETVGSKLTIMMTPQYDYSCDPPEPDRDAVAYYLKMLEEDHGEAGLSGAAVLDISIDDKLGTDRQFWQSTVPDYAFMSLYLDEEQLSELDGGGALPGMRSVVAGKNPWSAEPIVSYAEEGITLQRSLSNGEKHTFFDDFRLKCVETAIGYSSIVIDMRPAAYPENEGNAWERMSIRISSNVSTYWKSFRMFAATTITESDVRIRRFLALDYAQERLDNVITLRVSNFEEEAWFLLRTSKEEVVSVEGGSFVQVEEDCYLIGVEQAQVEIRVRPRDGMVFPGGGQ